MDAVSGDFSLFDRKHGALPYHHFSKGGVVQRQGCSDGHASGEKRPTGRNEIGAHCKVHHAAPRPGTGMSLRVPPNASMAARTGSAKTTERCDDIEELLLNSVLSPGATPFSMP